MGLWSVNKKQDRAKIRQNEMIQCVDENIGIRTSTAVPVGTK